jgi:hypothetical protein
LESPTANFCGSYSTDCSWIASDDLQTVSACIGLLSCGAIHNLIGDVDIGANPATKAFKDYLYKDLACPSENYEKNAEQR